MEKLKVQQVQEIVHRLRKGQSERSIARDLDCSRDTVRRYGRVALERGFLVNSVPLPSLEDLESATAPLFVPRRSNVSTVEPYRSVVTKLLEDKVEVVAIHRKLSRNHGYTGSYGSVLRFVRCIAPSAPDVVARVETAVGNQAQVDFGTVGKMWDSAKKRHRTAYCFVMTLSWSRHMYVRFVFDQRIPTWLECHRLAFEAFGGVRISF